MSHSKLGAQFEVNGSIRKNEGANSLAFKVASESSSSGESSCEDFGLVQNYNHRIKAIYQDRLKEKVLEGLAYHTTASQIKR